MAMVEFRTVDEVDLAVVRAALARLASARLAAPFSSQDEARYRELCRRELQLLGLDGSGGHLNLCDLSDGPPTAA
jgi:hypothetical protein